MPRSKSRGESLSSLSGSGGRKWLFPKCSHQMQRWANCRQSTLVTTTINRTSNYSNTNTNNSNINSNLNHNNTNHTTTIGATATTTTNGIPVPNQEIYTKNKTTTSATGAATTITDHLINKRTCSIMRLTTAGRNHCNNIQTPLNTDANTTINTKKYNRRSTAF